MLNNIEELIELIDSYDRWIKRVLVTVAALGLVYGGYKYGYSKGMDRAFDYVKDHVSDICAPADKAASSYVAPNQYEGQPGKMWDPEA